MKYLVPFICAIILFSCKNDNKPKSDQYKLGVLEPEKVIECLNKKLLSYDYGVDSLNLIQESDSVFKDIDSIVPFLYNRFRTVNSYNMIYLTFDVSYYYSTNFNSVLKLEKKLLHFFYDEKSRPYREKIIRLNNFIVCFQFYENFDDSHKYLESLMNRLIIDYVNNCGCSSPQSK